MSAKIHFIVNGIFSTTIAGGDIHFLKLALAAAQAGYELNFFGGHALKEVLAAHGVPGTLTLTDEAKMPKVNQGALGGQMAMFRDFYQRYGRTMSQLARIGPNDLAYAVSDYWFDVLPVVRSATRQKLMVLHMNAPNFGQIVRASRPDVDTKRLASLHYWCSQELSLRSFAKCNQRHIFYLHPQMRPRLQKLGFRPPEMTWLSYGLDVETAATISPQPRIYDVIWLGRVHRQKGVDDLLSTLAYLAGRLDGFRAVFLGNVREGLIERIKSLGLAKNIEFSGFVSEAEKVRLFKSSRVFLMPSKHEGSPRVIGESILAGTPVVAYELENYRPLFGDYAQYVPPFDLAAFQRTAEAEILRMRSGENYLDQTNRAEFIRQNSWATTSARFLAALAPVNVQK